GEERARLELGLDDTYCVQEPRLVDDGSDRRRRPERREPHGAERLELARGPAETRLRLTHVGPQPDECARHASTLQVDWRVVLNALLIATATGLVTGLGVVPFFFRETIPRRMFDGILGVGAGLMLSAATLGLLATALAEVRAGGQLNPRVLTEVILGFAVGVGLLALMERLPHEHAGGHKEHISRAHDKMDEVHPHEHQHAERVRQGLIISGAMTIHRLPEGFAIGAGFPGRTRRPLRRR